jgi:hypothetical protein
MDSVDKAAPRNTREIWVRGLVMLLFMVAMGFAQVLLNLVSVVQFIWLLVYGGRNEGLSDFGASLAKWSAQSILFLSCASNEKPFPWQQWPTASP